MAAGLCRYESSSSRQRVTVVEASTVRSALAVEIAEAS
jgi:hypothetical protein